MYKKMKSKSDEHAYLRTAHICMRIIMQLCTTVADLHNTAPKQFSHCLQMDVVAQSDAVCWHGRKSRGDGGDASTQIYAYVCWRGMERI